ncbi:MAG: NAD(P)/FAD-dependent oxidoreductase [Alphaproteobacteria bacterium]|nr:MAG: NAD(P)/FAD-dependent oxidoreductase [Alphaproteobacteria bacterium]
MFAHVPGLRRLHRLRLYALFELLYPGFSPGSLVARRVAALALGHLRAQVSDPGLRRQLRPDYPLGCKRILLSDDYYPALMRGNAVLVTTPIGRIAPAGVETVDGRMHGLDILVHATGFAASDFLPGLAVSGPDGHDLGQCWRDGAEAYLGIMTAGFPNLFFLYGPNTNIGHNSILFMLECQFRLITRLLDGVVRRRARTVAVCPAAMRGYNEEIAARLARGVWAAGCGNWYRNEGGRITNNWPGSTLEYWYRLRYPDSDAFIYDAPASGDTAPFRHQGEMADART